MPQTWITTPFLLISLWFYAVISPSSCWFRNQDCYCELQQPLKLATTSFPSSAQASEEAAHPGNHVSRVRLSRQLKCSFCGKSSCALSTAQRQLGSESLVQTLKDCWWKGRDGICFRRFPSEACAWKSDKDIMHCGKQERSLKME